MDITFELRMVENFKRSLKGKMTLFTCTYYSYVRYCIRYYSRHCSHRRIDDVALTDDVALIDEVSRSCSTKIFMHCWLVTWQHVNRPKIARTVHAYTQDYFQLNCVTIQTVSLFKPRGKTVYCWLMTWRNPERPNCFYSDGHNLLNVSIKWGPPTLIWYLWIHFWTLFSVILSLPYIFYIFK